MKRIIRFNSNVSLIPDPNKPGNPFIASFQPGLLPSISIPIPYGSSVANLINDKDTSLPNK
ncbi:hypothetical protein D3C78_1060290 [compost metagenome]